MRDTNSLRILIPFFGSRGGLLQYTSSFANALGKECNVHVTTRLRYHSRFKNHVDLHTLGRVHAYEVVKRTYGLCTDLQPDIIHFTGGHPLNIPIQLRFSRNPIVVTIHDPEPHEGMERPVYNFLKKWIQVQWGNRFLVHGPATEKAAIKKGYPQNRVHVIPHGLHDQYPEPCHHRFRDLNNQILIFGTIRPNKGYDKIPELVDEVAEEVPSVTAVVAGSADTAAQIDSTWINGIKERLRAHPRIELDEGFVSAENVKCLFKESKVVLLPYTDASQSGVAMLARTLHRPVVSTRTGDLPQAIDHGYTGFLREPCDTGGIALMVAELLTNRRTWCQFVKNIERTNEAFRWDRVVNRVRAIYHTLPD